MSRRSSNTDVSVKSERNPATRDPEKRSRPFTAVLLVALLVVPLFVLAFRTIVAFKPDLMWLIVWLDLLLFGALLPAVALGIGYRVTKRLPFVIWHVAITLHLFAAGSSLLIIVGWDRTGGGRWWERFRDAFLDTVTIPGYVLVIYLFGALCVAGSWLLYRIDAFRAATGAGDDGNNGIGAMLKWPAGAKLRTETITRDEFATEAIVDHPGVPISEVRAPLPAIEEHPGVIRGRSTIVPVGDQGGKSKIRLVHTDPHSVWRVWPGLTHPGRSYSYPLSTSYYSTGEKQWYSFVRTPDGMRSEHCPDFASPNATFKGSQGMTSSGKSGEAAIELADGVFSRNNVVCVYVDTAKLLQNASWCLDFCTLAAGSRPASGALWKALRRLGEYRGRVLGEAAVRDFDDEAVELTGMPWVHIFADEFDVAKQGADIEWLATKGRSLGFRFSFTLPRAVGDKLSTDIRAAIGMWAQFGITQDYDKGFVLSKETMQAGANPEQFGAKVPGAHYLEGAPGVDPKLYPIDCRSYQTRQDFGDLRRAVEAARATFTPADFTPGEYQVLADVAKFCRPSIVRAGAIGMDDDDDEPAGALPAGVLNPKGTPDMQKTLDIDEQGDDPADMSPELEAAFDQAASLDRSDITRALAELGLDVEADANRPIAQLPAGETGVQLIFDKPRLSPAETVAEFDAALVRMAERGVTRFQSADVIAEMNCVPSETWISKRFKGLCDDGEHVKFVPPDGLTIEREGRGSFLLVRITGVDADPNTHS